MKRQHMITLIMSLVLLLLIGVLFVPVPDRMIRDCVRGNHYTVLKWISRIRPDNRLRIMKDAFHYDNPEVVQILLDNGTDVNMKKQISPIIDIKSSLLVLAAQKKAYKCIHILLDNGAKINNDSYRILAGFRYVYFPRKINKKEFEKCIEKLATHGIDINACLGGTTLHEYFAYAYSDPFVYDVYRKHGFDPRTKNSKGQTISDIIKLKKSSSKKKNVLLKRIEKDVEDLNKRNIPIIKNPACPNIYYD